MATNDMPFLAHLAADEGYGLHHVYSGIPSSTPAVQAEMFYGVPMAVPAFAFFDRTVGRVVHMWEREPASRIEAGFADRRSLLEHGSSYANIYTGRADQTRFCMASLGWTDPFRTRHPLVLPAVLALYGWELARAVALLAREVVIGLGDFAASVVRGRHVVSELKFAWSRALIAVLLRELVAIWATIDLGRGVPVVHLNLLGYDEYAHRRSPRSRRSRAALRGIDTTIARLVRSARGSRRRSYEVWVLSDHGQEITQPYIELHGRAVEEAVRAVVSETDLARSRRRRAEHPRGIQGQRARQLSERLMPLVVPGTESGAEPRAGEVIVTAQGPLGFVYLPEEPSADERNRLAAELVRTAQIPLVLTSDGPGHAVAHTVRGRFVLPADGAAVLGDDHPYLHTAAAELAALCDHPNAGDLVISGWRPDGPSISFPRENGSHGGPGPDETDSFLFAPTDTKVVAAPGAPLRHADLRTTALELLDAPVRPLPRLRTDPPSAAAESVLRVLTYNVHSCVGLDGRLSPERIARVIARHDPDVVALQEVDVGRARTGGVDQAEQIAELLEMILQFHPTLEVEEERYGDAVLSRLPMRLVKAGPLPALRHRPPLEPRGALWVELETAAGPVQLVNTHLSLHPLERRLEVEALLGAEWLGSIDPGQPTVLCGDFNAMGWFPSCRRLRRRLHDAQVVKVGHRPRATWAGRMPIGRIDHVFVDPSIEVRHVEVPAHSLAKVASDHFPLLADLRLRSD